ncbi:chromosome segregation protein SMC [Acidithiobacillus ferrianus]|uniref:Chromosome partition protein Smc n=2 Tax=Acidithiobacillus ferrianus TaxID=2678518 RepID=A0A845UAR5_9PROT|nr:chromosome segregation protein SMC [Acidithiobacillus ferrianus]NDU43943.1 chromosome segregation protein SMC [Acidithiobacillus ferrianus]
MRLSAIVLQGFKSFRENTHIRLDANPVVIVGPNGCGKSNMVDAIRWVLGESSARQLRGGTLNDVISNGGGRRPAASVATVELRFDNADGAAPGAFADVAEISIKRSLDRKGDGHYRINGARCRRRDVGDIFLGTGLGGNAYAIVEQGTIGRIIEARPDDLRAILEEAGGISRYKERRRETAQRIAETREHLQRLHDIHGEMESRWQHLQRQAQAARTLRTLRREERQWQWWSLVLRLESLAAEHQRTSMRYADLQEKIQQEEDRLSTAVRLLDQLREEGRRGQETITAMQGELYAIQARQSDVEHRYREQQQAVQRCLSQRAQQRAQRQTIQAERTRHDDHETRRQQRAQSLAERRRVLMDEEEHVRHARQLAERDWERQDQARQRQEHALADMRRQRDVIAAQIQEMEPRLRDIERRLQLQSAEVPSERIALETLEMRCREGETALREAAAEHQAQRVALEAAQRYVMQSRESRDAAQARQVERAARQSALESLLQRLQPPAKKEVPGEIRLMDHIQVRPGWERAVEEVLRGRLHAAVVDEEAVVAQGTVLWRCVAMLPSLAEDALVQVVERPETFDVALNDWLWGLRLAPDLTAALSQRAQLRAGEAWITPQGVVVHRSGMVFPEHEGGASLLQCRRELQENGEALALAQTQAASAQAVLTEAERQCRSLEERTRAAEIRWQGLYRQDAQEREALARLRSRVEAEDQRRAESVKESQRLASERHAVDTRLHGLRQDLVASETEWQALDQAVLDARRVSDALRRRVDDLRAGYGRLREERQSLDLQQQRLQAESEAATARAGDLRQQWEQLTALLTQGNEERLRLQAAQPGIVAARDAIAAARAQQSAALATLQTAAQAGEERVRQQERQRHHLETQHRALQQSKATAEQQLAGLQARLEELRQQSAVIIQDLGDDPGPCPDATRCEEALARIGAHIVRLGNVNLAAEEELQALDTRRNHLLVQLADVESALRSLEEAMAAMDQETSTRFRDTLDQVNHALQELFAILFDGGQAQLRLVGEDGLDAGLVLRAQPPGKRNATLQQLSGGEKALTAIALVFALFRLNPAPFCVLDEVDAPLDDANVGRFCHLVREMAVQTQFLLVTHRSLTMQVAEQWIGVTMTEPGISRIVPVQVAETLTQASLREPAAP